MIGSISRKVSDDRQGAVLGVTGSLVSLSLMIGPFIGGFMIHYLFPGSLGLASAFAVFIGLIMIVRDKSNSTPSEATIH